MSNGAYVVMVVGMAVVGLVGVGLGYLRGRTSGERAERLADDPMPWTCQYFGHAYTPMLIPRAHSSVEHRCRRCGHPPDAVNIEPAGAHDPVTYQGGTK